MTASASVVEALLTEALEAELTDGGVDVPYSVIAERVAAGVTDRLVHGVEKLREAAKSALDFLDLAPLESGICCCGDPIKGRGIGHGHSPVDDLSYHSSEVAKNLRAALAPQPAEQDAREAVARIEELAGWFADGESGSHTLSHTVAAEHAADLRTILALTQAAPDGWRLVPVEPTEAMIEAGRVVGSLRFANRASDTYRAMLSASPAPPAQGEGS